MLKKSDRKKQEALAEGIDFYIENGFVVFTSSYLLRRGFCCKNGCRHCPYRPDRPIGSTA